MKLTKNFSLEEFEQSETARKYKIDNSVPAELVPNILSLCLSILQPLRNALGCININSGYRSLELNSLINGSETSQHMKGEAADIFSQNCSVIELYDKIQEMRFDYDQLIFEKRGNIEWVHISHKNNGLNRKEAFKIIK